MTEPQKEWLAWIEIGAGSSWSRQFSKEDAIERTLKLLKDWDRLYDVYDQDVVVHVVEVTGYDDLVWGYEGVHGVREGDEEGKYTTVPYTIEHLKRRTPPKAKTKKKSTDYRSTSLCDFS